MNARLPPQLCCYDDDRAGCAVRGYVMFLRRHMLELHKADGIEKLGDIKWQLTLCLIAVYLICYFSLWKGISTSGKVSKSSSNARRTLSDKTNHVLCVVVN